MVVEVLYQLDGDQEDMDRGSRKQTGSPSTILPGAIRSRPETSKIPVEAGAKVSVVNAQKGRHDYCPPITGLCTRLDGLEELGSPHLHPISGQSRLPLKFSNNLRQVLSGTEVDYNQLMRMNVA